MIRVERVICFFRLHFIRFGYLSVRALNVQVDLLYARDRDSKNRLEYKEFVYKKT